MTKRGGTRIEEARLTDEEVAAIRGRRPGVRASLACEGLFLTVEEEALLDGIEEDRLGGKEGDERVLAFIRDKARSER